MRSRPAGHALVEALHRPGRRHRLRRARRELPGRARRFSRAPRADPLHRLPAGRRRRLHGRGAGQAQRPAGHLLRHPRPGRDQRQHRRAHRVPGLDADDPVRRPGGQRPARPRGLPGDRLPPDVRPRHAGHGQVGGRGARRRPPARVRGARLPHRAAGPARAGGAGAARGHADARRPRRRCCRASSRRSAWPAPGALRELRAAAAGGRSGRCVIAGGSGWDAEGCRRAAALCRELAAAGGLRLPLPGHLRQPAPAVRRRCRHRHQPEAGGARARGRPDRSRWACAWAR